MNAPHGFEGGERRLLFSRPAPEGGRRRRFSALTRRILFFNAIVLVFLLGGVILVQSTRVGLIDERLAGIKQQSLIVAGTLAEYTTDENTRSIKTDEAEPLLRQLIAPTSLRARLYGTEGRLEVDTRDLLARNIVQTYSLPPIDFWSHVEQVILRVYNGVMGVRPFVKLDPYFEAGKDGRVYSEVVDALSGKVSTKERVDERNRLVLSVAVPIQRFRTVYGVLMVSTEGGDIDNVLREERATLMEVFLVGFIVMLMSSLYLSGFIAEPIRRLAAAADRVRHGRPGRETIPVMNERNDEIGELADSLSAMTRALYDRIDSIESFAADVAHELKNPLTSLKSAVEMLVRTKDDEAKSRLMAILRDDIKRIDRLITDISQASRIDAELSREPVEAMDIAHLLETIVEVYRLTALPRGVSVALRLDLPPGSQIMGRSERLGQIFRNLIDNAVSFSPDGGTVTVSADIILRSVRITVDDEGPGIPPDNLETIFNRFYTERPAGQDFGRNSGLGLSIARQIVEGADGRIWAENRKSETKETAGARFVVELPLSRDD
ncbi:MAG: stimulus-sensing domain-containing protein [Pseudomonadota bacterium]|nr:stimulus-sensing domain-containing protein [Pseudomonadota bacterium]